MALRKTSSSLINKLCFVTAARVPSLPVALARSFNTKAPFPPYIIVTPPYLLEFPYMEGVGKGLFLNEDENNAYFRKDMPGLGIEDVKVAIEKRKINMNRPGFGNICHALTVEGEKEYELGEKVIENGKEVEKKIFKSEYVFSPTVFKTDELMWVINNGVLRVLIPRRESDKEAFLARGTILKACERGVRKEWYVKEEEGKGLAIRVDMPGLTRDHVKVFLEEDERTLVIEGQGDEESKYEEYGRRYIRCKLDITDFSKTERSISMENGLFLLTIPPK